MHKNLFKTLVFVLTVILLSLSVCAAYPSSNKKIPDGSVLLEGKIIGEQMGWGGNEWSGRAAAFDGDIYSYYDPTQGQNDSCYAGMKLSEPYILTMVCIMPREGQLARFNGGMIQGSNDGKKWTTLWQSKNDAASFDWQVVTKFKNNTGYTYYRYFNDTAHGDVAEVELYGYAGTSDGMSFEVGVVVGKATVLFDSNGGNGEFDSIEVAFGSPYPEITYTPTRDGMVFDGWYTSPIGGEAVDGTKNVTDPLSHTLYAHWSEEVVEIEIVDDTEQEIGFSLTEIQGLSITISVVFLLVAVVAVLSRKKI